MKPKKIRIDQIYRFAEDGGRTLIKVGKYELKDGIKRGKRHCFIIDHSSSSDVYLISKEACDKIFNPFSLTADLETAFRELELTVKNK